MSVRLPASRLLYRAAQVRELDSRSARAQGIERFILMQRAGQAAFRQLRAIWPAAKRILVLAGPGNNGGDGYVTALEGIRAGLATTLVQIGDGNRIKGDAARAREAFMGAGGTERVFTNAPFPDCDVLVDALFGTGLDRVLDGAGARAAHRINEHAAPVLAVDIPSGLNADTGMPMNDAVVAQCTVSFVALKRGLVTGKAGEHCGELIFEDLGTPAAVYESLHPAAQLIDPDIPRTMLPPRSRCAHKGDFGHVLVVGGDHGMAGAARLAGEAALRSGAGRVTLATRADHAVSLITSCPSLMAQGIESGETLKNIAQGASVIALGPGLGTSEWSKTLYREALASGLPVVLDADALNLLSLAPERREGWVLTPHPGEAGRLLGCSGTEIQADRYGAAQALQSRFGGTIILKGAGTIIQHGDNSAVCPLGNPGMAAAGMGDVLTGIVAALLSQGLTPEDSALTAVLLHAQAGDISARQGERGLLASDLLATLRQVVNPQ